MQNCEEHKGEILTLSTASASALLSRRVAAVAVCPFAHANIKAVYPFFILCVYF
jgi:hypothetical protein